MLLSNFFCRSLCLCFDFTIDLVAYELAGWSSQFFDGSLFNEAIVFERCAQLLKIPVIVVRGVEFVSRPREDLARGRNGAAGDEVFDTFRLSICSASTDEGDARIQCGAVTVKRDETTGFILQTFGIGSAQWRAADVSLKPNVSGKYFVARPEWIV